MRPIRAQLLTGWKRMAETRLIAVGDGLLLDKDCGRRWIAGGEGSWPERDCRRRWMTRWIKVTDRSRPDMDHD